ncbi:MAG: hypothetical protein KC503_14540 [Myxococcales bacterium]|nr:hypothetical protein [Myxococcales bacterium]
MDHQFEGTKTCPKCNASFDRAPLEERFKPVVVVTCPQCGTHLWLPGFDADGKLVEFDTNADDGL